MRLCLCASVVLASLQFTTGGVHAATITVDVATKHQTVDGFGMTRDNISPWQVRVGPFYETVDLTEAGFYDSIAQDFQVGRLVLEPLLDSMGADYNDINLEHIQEFIQRGLTTFFAAVQSPPAYMKDNNSLSNGGHLLPEYYEDFALMCAEYTRQFKEKTGVDLYGICLQIEPGFVEPYASCVYNATTYRDLMHIAAPILDSAAPNTKILAPQDVLNTRWTISNTWMKIMLADSVIRPHLDIYAVNCHWMFFDSATAPARTWYDGVRSVADTNDLTLWLTSTGDRYDTTWSHAVRAGVAIANSFKYGNITMWNWWGTCSGYEHAIIREGHYTAKYYQSAHYGRFVKPGARRIESASSEVGARFADVAFQNPDGTIVIVAANGTETSEELTLVGTGLPDEFQVYQSTSDSSLMRDLGTVTSTTSASLPAMSTTTLVSTGASPIGRNSGVHRTALRNGHCVGLPNGSGVAVETAEPSMVSIEVYSSTGQRLGRDHWLVPAAQRVVLKDAHAQSRAAGVYIARVRIASRNGGSTSEHTVPLTVR